VHDEGLTCGTARSGTLADPAHVATRSQRSASPRERGLGSIPRAPRTKPVALLRLYASFCPAELEPREHAAPVPKRAVQPPYVTAPPPPNQCRTQRCSDPPIERPSRRPRPDLAGPRSAGASHHARCVVATSDVIPPNRKRRRVDQDPAARGGLMIPERGSPSRRRVDHAKAAAEALRIRPGFACRERMVRWSTSAVTHSSGCTQWSAG